MKRRPGPMPSGIKPSKVTKNLLHQMDQAVEEADALGLLTWADWLMQQVAVVMNSPEEELTEALRLLATFVTAWIDVREDDGAGIAHRAA